MSLYTPQYKSYESNLNRDMFVCFLCIFLKDVFHVYEESGEDSHAYSMVIYVLLCLIHFVCIKLDIYENSIKALIACAIAYFIFNDSIISNKIYQLTSISTTKYFASIIALMTLVFLSLIANILSINNLYIVKSIGMREILWELLPNLLSYFALALLVINIIKYYKYNKLTILLSEFVLTLMIVVVTVIKVSQERIRSIFPSYLPIAITLFITFLYIILEIQEIIQIKQVKSPCEILLDNINILKVKETILECIKTGIINGFLEIEVTSVNENFEYKEDEINKKIIMSEVNFQSLLNTLKELKIQTKVSQDIKMKILEGKKDKKLSVFSNTMKISNEFRYISKNQIEYIFPEDNLSSKVNNVIDTLNKYFQRNDDHYNFLKVGALYLNNLICNAILYTLEELDNEFVCIAFIIFVLVILTGIIYLLKKDTMITMCFFIISLVISMLNYERALFLHTDNTEDMTNIFLMRKRIGELTNTINQTQKAIGKKGIQYMNKSIDDIKETIKNNNISIEDSIENIKVVQSAEDKTQENKEVLIKNQEIFINVKEEENKILKNIITLRTTYTQKMKLMNGEVRNMITQKDNLKLDVTQINISINKSKDEHEKVKLNKLKTRLENKIEQITKEFQVLDNIIKNNKILDSLQNNMSGVGDVYIPLKESNIFDSESEESLRTNTENEEEVINTE